MVKGADFKINLNGIYLGPLTDMKQGITRDLSCVRVGQIKIKLGVDIFI